MYAFLMLLAGAALAGAHLLRAPGKGGVAGAAIAFFAGLALTAGGIRLCADRIGIGRTTPFDGFVNHAVDVAREDAAPLIVFSGASFSRNAIDEERLTAALRARGYPHRVVSLSLEAASLLERDAYLEQFLRAAPRPPAIVFVEVAEVTDYRPTFIFGNSKFSTRAIEQFDPRATAWTATGLAGGGCKGAVDCVKEAGFLGAHTLLNAVNIGLVGQGERAASVAPQSAYDATFKPRTVIEPEIRRHQLATRLPLEARNGPDWAMSFRAIQRKHLLEAGTAEVAYYFPPVIAPGARAYSAGLCAGELKSFTCLSPDAPELLSRLDGDIWLDEEHLLDPGAELYTTWLADQIAASGILERAP